MIFNYLYLQGQKKDLAGQIHKLKSLIINAIIIELRLIVKIRLSKPL